MVNVIKLFKSYRNFLKPLCQYVSYCRLFVSFLISLPFNNIKGNATGSIAHVLILMNAPFGKEELIPREPRPHQWWLFYQ